MKAILEFELPADKENFDASAKGMDWAIVAWDLDQLMRNMLKYGHEYKDADTAQTLDINGDETFSFSGLSEEELRPGSDIKITMSTTEGLIKTFTTKARIDTPVELEYFQNGGILQFVLRKLAMNSTP